MKSIPCILLALAASLAVANAADLTPVDSPYTAIAARNVFNLAPIIEPGPCVPMPVELPPRLLPNGIITILGRPQVLFKVVVLQNSPGAQTRSFSYLLGEGERTENIEVLKIDLLAGTVTFNNHGTIQQLPLANSAATATDHKPPPTPAQILFNVSGRAG